MADSAPSASLVDDEMTFFFFLITVAVHSHTHKRYPYIPKIFF